MVEDARKPDLSPRKVQLFAPVNPATMTDYQMEAYFERIYDTFYIDELVLLSQGSASYKGFVEKGTLGIGAIITVAAAGSNKDFIMTPAGLKSTDASDETVYTPAQVLDFQATGHQPTWHYKDHEFIDESPEERLGKEMKFGIVVKFGRKRGTENKLYVVTNPLDDYGNIEASEIYQKEGQEFIGLSSTEEDENIVEVVGVWDFDRVTQGLARLLKEATLPEGMLKTLKQHAAMPPRPFGSDKHFRPIMPRISLQEIWDQVGREMDEKENQ